MNAWVPKRVDSGKTYRVTAGGAEKMAIWVPGGTLTTVRTTVDGGTTWLDVTASFVAKGTGRYVHSFAVNNELLGAIIEITTSGPSAYVLQED